MWLGQADGFILIPCSRFVRRAQTTTATRTIDITCISAEALRWHDEWFLAALLTVAPDPDVSVIFRIVYNLFPDFIAYLPLCSPIFVRLCRRTFVWYVVRLWRGGSGF